MVKPTSVPIETVAVGDEIDATFDSGDVVQTNRGTVAVILRLGEWRKLVSAEGVTIARYSYRNPRAVSCVMIRRYTPEQPGLFEVSE